MKEERSYHITAEGKDYFVTLHRDADDGGYWIECQALPGCASQGDTVPEALNMIKDAIKGHLAVI